ncbi:hypothetical protein H0H93_003219, partial [Arthromyces matolae]
SEDEDLRLPRGAPYPQNMPQMYPSVPYPQYASPYRNPYGYPLHSESFPPSPAEGNLRAPIQWGSPNAASSPGPPLMFNYGPSPRNVPLPVSAGPFAADPGVTELQK